MVKWIAKELIRSRNLSLLLDVSLVKMIPPACQCLNMKFSSLSSELNKNPKKLILSFKSLQKFPKIHTEIEFTELSIPDFNYGMDEQTAN